MTIQAILTGIFLAAALTGQVVGKHSVVLTNWPAPLYWQPARAEMESFGLRTEVRSASPNGVTPSSTPSALAFVAMTPCRVVDTRVSQMFAAPFGPPGLTPGPARSFPIPSSTLCSIPTSAQAYSFNVTVVPPSGLGYLKVWPTGVPEPNAVTLDDIIGDIRNNAAIVPAGTPNGSVSAVVNANTDLVIDINGYYAPLNNTGLVNTNTGVGDGALFANTTGISNTASGSQSLFSNTTGFYNTASGHVTLFNNSTGSYNTATGEEALFSNTIGFGNTAHGYEALYHSTASNNTALGWGAGYLVTAGGDNIDIGNRGTADDANTIRIGDSARQNSFFAAGIQGVATGQANAIPIMIDSNGQFGTVNSSRRYKEDIQDMAGSSSGLLRLRPVTYRYQRPYTDGSKPIDYGLIAEEVAEVYPDLVVKGAQGEIETVQYQKLLPMLLNELQRLQARVAALEAASLGSLLLQ